MNIRQPSNGDDELFGWDENGNPLTLQTRGDAVITSVYDALNRVTGKAVPAYGAGSARLVSYGYDKADRRTSAADDQGHALSWGYDAAGRLISALIGGPQWSAAKGVWYGLDGNGNRTRLTWPDGYFVDYGYDALNRMESATDSATAVLAELAWNPLSQRTGIDYDPAAGGAAVDAGFTTTGDLTSLAHGFNGAANDVTYAGGFDRSHKLVSETIASANPAWRWSGFSPAPAAYTPDKKNRYAST